MTERDVHARRPKSGHVARSCYGVPALLGDPSFIGPLQSAANHTPTVVCKRALGCSGALGSWPNGGTTMPPCSLDDDSWVLEWRRRIRAYRSFSGVAHHVHQDGAQSASPAVSWWRVARFSRDGVLTQDRLGRETD